MICKQALRLLLGFTIASLTAGCAAIQPPETGGPRSGPAYPIVFTEQAQRTQASIVAFDRLANRPIQTGRLTELQLQPVTATIRSLPPSANANLYLPRIGVGAEMTEEETRESLRRFINDWQVLIGANPAHLSLVERADRPDGIKVAKYEQRPFRYPLRGGYGTLEIQFQANRVLRSLTSSCIPDAERLQTSLLPITPRLTAEEAVKQMREGDFVPANSGGQQVTNRMAQSDEVNAVELVTYVTPAPGRTDTLELHLAWEIAIGATAQRLVYLDAVDGKMIGGPVVP